MRCLHFWGSCSVSRPDRRISVVASTRIIGKLLLVIKTQGGFRNKMKYALLSVSNRKGLVPLVECLYSRKYRIICTDGTYSFLWNELDDKNKRSTTIRSSLEALHSVTGVSEMLEGRVKSLHPTVHGGILWDRDRASHVADSVKWSLPDIRVVVCNFYPFGGEDGTVKPVTDEEATALTDIGGVALVRSAAKNWKHCTVLTDPSQYEEFISSSQEDGPDASTRRRLAQNAFEKTSEYDRRISLYFAGEDPLPSSLVRSYKKVTNLKYGCNPHQKPAALYAASDPALRVLNGSLGYINILDAFNAFGLAREISDVCGGRAAAVSIKHTMPTGAAVTTAWKDIPERSRSLLTACWGVSEKTPESVITYARARNADPLSSFGDFIGYSGVVDTALAKFIANTIADGIVARGYSEEGLALLRAKKKGSFVVLEHNGTRSPAGSIELRDVGDGLTLAQAPNTALIDGPVLSKNVPTSNKTLDAAAVQDLAIANAAIKYAQSNSVAVASGGQLIGVAAGQQSRVDAVRLVGTKTRVWLARHGDRARESFASHVGGRQEKIVASTAVAREVADSQSAKDLALAAGSPVMCLASDGFFPFADGVETAVAGIPGLRFLSQPGGSTRDEDIVEAANSHGLVMSLTGVRVFSH